MGELQRTTAETETNFQCGNFESWKKDQIMIHILCLTRHTYEKTLFVKICNAQSTFFPNLETFIFNNSFLKVKGPSRSFLKRWEYQIILPVSWETCMQVKKQVKTLHGRTDWFKIGKGIPQGCILSPSLFNLYAEYIMWNARLDESQTGIKIAGRNINNLRYVDDTTLMAESEEELKNFWMRVKEESKTLA